MILEMTISVDIAVEAFEDISGMTKREIINAVLEHVLDERNALATEARIAAIRIMAGESLTRPG